MSKIKRAIVAAVSALGLSVAMITPASASTAAYNCGSGGIMIQVNRMSPWPKIRVDLGAFFNPAPVAVGGMVMTLYPPPGVVPSFTVTNSTAIPFGALSSLTLTGTPLPGALDTPDFMKLVTSAMNFTCSLATQGAGPWPIP